MVPDIIYYIVGVIIIIVIVVLILGFWGYGQPIKCPNCGFKFKRPTPHKGSIGFGFSFRGAGSYTCPNCKFEARTSKFERAPDLDNSEVPPKPDS